VVILASVAFLGASKLSCGCMSQAPCKGFVVPPILPLSRNELASVACSLENKVSLCSVGRLRVITPLQRRRTSPQKERTTGIHPCVSVSTLRLFLSLTCILLATCLLACLPLIGNSLSCTSSEFTLCQAFKLKKIKKIDLAPIHPPLVAHIDPFNWYQSKGSLIGLYRLRDHGR
jgi:hypothetical protein